MRFQSTADQLIQKIALHQCVQLSAPAGSGKSHFLRGMAKKHSWLYLETDHALPSNLPANTTIVINYFENILTHQPLLNYLASHYKVHRPGVSFIFGTHSPITDPIFVASLGRISELLTQNIIELPALTALEASEFIDECAQELGIPISAIQKKSFIQQAGGHIRTLKRLVEVEGDTTSPRYKQLIYETTSVPEFTPLEIKAYELLKSNSNQVVSRDDLITCIWGDAADTSISDGALDQLLYRLKAKLKLKGLGSLQTLRGRGHKLLNKQTTLLPTIG